MSNQFIAAPAMQKSIRTSLVSKIQTKLTACSRERRAGAGDSERNQELVEEWNNPVKHLTSYGFNVRSIIKMVEKKNIGAITECNHF